LTAVAERHETSPGAVAVAWTLHKPAVDAAIVGLRSPEQLDPLVYACNLSLSDEDLSYLETY
jgi:aryl-alcohol dehydrogenase-like predicted oxidoreductase